MTINTDNPYLVTKLRCPSPLLKSRTKSAFVFVRIQISIPLWSPIGSCCLMVGTHNINGTWFPFILSILILVEGNLKCPKSAVCATKQSESHIVLWRNKINREKTEKKKFHPGQEVGQIVQHVLARIQRKMHRHMAGFPDLIKNKDRKKHTATHTYVTDFRLNCVE